MITHTVELTEVERLRILLNLAEMSQSALQAKLKQVSLVSKSRLRRLNAQAATIRDLRKELSTRNNKELYLDERRTKSAHYPHQRSFDYDDSDDTVTID